MTSLYPHRKTTTAKGYATSILQTERCVILIDSQATVFGILANPIDVKDVLNPTLHLTQEYKVLLQRIEQWMREQHPNEMVSIIPDVIENCKHNLSACLADFLYRSTAGKAMRHIVVTPFWVDSSVTVGAQLADVVAYILMNSMRPTENRRPIPDLWRKVVSMEFRSNDLETRGIKRVRRRDNQQAGADAR